MFFMLTIGGAIGIFLIVQLYVATRGYDVPMVVLVSLVGAGVICFLGSGRYIYRLDGSPLRGPVDTAPAPTKVGL